MTTFERIKKLAKERGLSLTKLNDKANLGTNSIYHWKTKTPSTESLTKVADVLDVSVDYLLGNDIEKTESNSTLSDNQKLIAYSIDPEISDEERDAIIEMVQAAIKLRRRL